MVTGHATAGARAASNEADVGDPVLLSKMTPPAMPGWAVPRSRIDRLIADGVLGPLTVVTGPPGAGKTVAIASWAATRTDACPLVWINLDEYDNPPHVFWSYVIAALRQAGITVPEAQAAAATDSDGHEFLLRLAAALAAAGSPVIVVLEDLHLLKDPETLDGLAYVLKNAAPFLHLVISSRIDPLLPLHRYRLHGELAEIRADDLAFSVSESGLLMAQHGLRLSTGSLATLVERTEGWAAGIRLAAISLDGHPDPGQFVKELGAEDSAVTGYLVDEVLGGQTASVRDFLLRTSILEHVSADVAGELSCDEQDTDVLPGLASANAFIRPLGHGWYRYHPLFAEMLRLKLRREYPGQLPKLHRRAATWYLRNGRLTEAVRHAAASGDWLFAARMALDQLAVGQLIAPSGSPSLAEEFRRMPRDPTWTQPQPLLVAAALGLSGPPGIVSTWLSAAERLLAQAPEEENVPARLAAALIRLAFSRQTGDLGAAVAASTRAESLLQQVPQSLLAAQPAIGVEVLLGRGAVQLWAGAFDEAAATLRAGMAASAGPDGHQAAADCAGHLALAQALRGRLGRAGELAGDLAQAAERNGQARPCAAASVTLAYLHLERDELAQAQEELMSADAALRRRPDKLLSVLAGLIAARRSLAQGRAGAALEQAGRARLGRPSPGWLERSLALVESRAATAAGNLQVAIDAAGRAGSPSAPEVAAVLAHAWLAVGDQQAAGRALAAVAADSGAQAEESSLEGWLADARLGYGSGDGTRGRRSLERALQLGQPEQLRLSFIME
jgi:LuxR family transcriptional regulator, maltose regulon positive regulatory protein